MDVYGICGQMKILNEGTRSFKGAFQELKVPLRDGTLPASGVCTSSRREATDGASTHCRPEATAPHDSWSSHGLNRS